ncbi:MAG: hypothetical protein AAF772_00215 [Acidobacteriota bacterium]
MTTTAALRHTIGIRLEDKSVWERRVPLVPADIAQLQADHPGLSVHVQGSPLRVYDDAGYRAVGATIVDQLDEARVVLAVKEIPISLLRARTTYVFFAHVIKGQAHNMPLLRRLLDLHCTLIDYERVVDDAGHRLIFFGRQAGQAGMLESLRALGQRLAWEGQANPLSAIRPAHEYRDLADACDHLDALRDDLDGFADARGGGARPLVFAFTGGGNVTRGALDVFERLPHRTVTAETLAARGIDDLGGPGLVKVQLTGRAALYTPRDPSQPFDRATLETRPEDYRGALVDLLPQVTALIHGIYWDPRYPRLLTREQAARLVRDDAPLRLVGDVTCDIGGSIAITDRPTQPDRPTYVYRPDLDRTVDGVEGEGIVVLAVDNLPCELPRDASDQFSAALAPFVPALASADYRAPFAQLALPDPIRRAVVAHGGALTPDYRALEVPLVAHGGGAV